MITTTIYIISIIVVLALGAIVAWLMRKNAVDVSRQLQATNQDLRSQLETANGKTQLLTTENANSKLSTPLPPRMRE